MNNLNLSTRDKLLDSGYTEIYTYGFQGCSVDRILKNAKVPKGSMYHSFKSKKDLALAVIDDRISPKMLTFFSFKNEKQINEIDFIVEKIKQMSEIEYLISYGCPLNKLVREMYSLDDDFKIKLENIYAQILKNIQNLLDEAVKNKTLSFCETKELAQFIYSSVIGNLSLGEGNISKDSFLSSLSHLFTYLESLKID